MTIREVARTGLLSEYALRLLETQGKLPGIYVGRRKMVNLPLLINQLERESRVGGGDNNAGIETSIQV